MRMKKYRPGFQANHPIGRKSLQSSEILGYVATRNSSKALTNSVSTVKLTPIGSSYFNTSFPHQIPSLTIALREIRVQKASKLRYFLQHLTAFTSILSLLITIGAYSALTVSKTAENSVSLALKAGVGVGSLVQIWAVVNYWKTSLAYFECIRVALRYNAPQIPRLCNSPQAILNCVLECLLHLLILIPHSESCEFTLFGIDLSVDFLCFCVILARNYHCCRWIYWNSHYSSLRTAFLIQISDSPLEKRLLIRSFLRDFGLIGVISMAAVWTSAAILTITSAANSDVSLSDFYVIALAQARIGYGHIQLESRLVQCVLVLTAICGIALFGVFHSAVRRNLRFCGKESAFFYEMGYRTMLKGQKTIAVTLIQTWWRSLGRTREKKYPKGEISVFSSRIHDFRTLLSKRPTSPSLHLHSQIHDLSSLFSSKVRFSGRLLSSSMKSESLLQEILRNEYQICMLVKRIYENVAARGSPRSRKKRTLSTIFEEGSERSSRNTPRDEGEGGRGGGGERLEEESRIELKTDGALKDI